MELKKITYAEKLAAIEDYAALKLTSRQFADIIGPDVSFRVKYKDRISAAKQARADAVSKRDLEVIYITGGSGSGKSTACKYFAEKLGFEDPFISGTGDDILDGYDKQKCIILDDFRGGTLKFSELLKFLDNNTNSMLASRYHNKDISCCRLVMINSVRSPSELYSNFKEEDEPAEQLYRRLKHHYYRIEDFLDGTDKIIKEYSLTTKEVKYTGKAVGVMSDIYRSMGIDPNKCDDNSMMNEFAFTYRDLKPLSPVESSKIDQILFGE